MKISLLSRLLLLILFFISCQDRSGKKLKSALDNAGENKCELQQVLEHYKHDSLKLKAARYLIENMPYHFSRDDYFLSPDKKKHQPRIPDFKDINTYKRYCDSLTSKGYITRRDILPDSKHIKAEYLIRNIELAFEVWKKPWSGNLSFDNFCHYILPYRITNEPLPSLRQEIMQKYLPLLEEANATSPLEACRIINEQLKTEINYTQVISPFYPSIEETYHSGLSRCEGLCNLGVYIMRSLGIPVTLDHTIWTKMSLAHYWGVVLDNSIFHCFGPGEDNPGDFIEKLLNKRSSIPAKVYRFRFEPYQPGKKWNDTFRSFLKSPLIIDVTEEYPLNTFDLELYCDIQTDKKEATVYLCALNYSKWEPIAIGERKDNRCKIGKVMGDNIFILADSQDGMSFRYLTAPFFLDSNGKINKLIPEEAEKIDYQHVYFHKGLNAVQPLGIWDIEKSSFVILKPDEVVDHMAFFKDLPKNALYKIINPTLPMSRPFIFIDNKKIFY